MKGKHWSKSFFSFFPPFLNSIEQNSLISIRRFSSTTKTLVFLPQEHCLHFPSLESWLHFILCYSSAHSNILPSLVPSPSFFGSFPFLLWFFPLFPMVLFCFRRIRYFLWEEPKETKMIFIPPRLAWRLNIHHSIPRFHHPIPRFHDSIPRFHHSLCSEKMWSVLCLTSAGQKFISSRIFESFMAYQFWLWFQSGDLFPRRERIRGFQFSTKKEV